jgi:hypothetical protein
MSSLKPRGLPIVLSHAPTTQVLDHDNLSRAIIQTIKRIEKSHQRGEECALYAEIDKSNAATSKTRDEGIKIPRVFPMTQEMCINKSQKINNDKSSHFHPASEDPWQFTLLKFYELNKSAVKMLLDGQDDNMDLPFTPGPKEHTIIHHSPTLKNPFF